MKTVRTVLGDIQLESLGHTQCHEHIFIERGKSAEVSDALVLDDFEKGVGELSLYRQAGGSAIVDAQPPAAGRMAEWLAAASRASGVHIVASTGFHKTIFYYDDSYVFSQSEEAIAQLYIDEITLGMSPAPSRERMVLSTSPGVRTGTSPTEEDCPASHAGPPTPSHPPCDGQMTTTGKSLKGEETNLSLRAGLIKTAVDKEGIFADATYEKLHTAAAETQLQTGAPLMCHMEKGADAMEVIRFYLDKGVQADRIWLAHLDRATYDFTYHREILSCGVYLEYDTIARRKYHSDEDERRLLINMIDAGYEDRLLLGLDTTNARMKSYGAPIGLDYILKTFLPFLSDAGISKAQIKKMMVENPRRALGMGM